MQVNIPKIHPPKIRAPKIRPPKIQQRKPEIIIGIPTYNEADNIEELVKTLDEGLRKYFPNKKALIVNADANSSDGTKKLFMSTKTKTPKKCMKVPRGKGAGVKELLGYFLSKDSAETLMMVDGDVRSVTPRWVRNMITPILKGFDHNFPIFNRQEFDGSVTDHLAYPVMRGIMGINIRQPLAGEVALSKRAVDRIYNRGWPLRADKYGIDVFMSFSSVLGELRVAESYLGMKEHDLSEPKLGGMFEDVATSLFELLDENRGFWDGRLRIRKPPIFFKDTRTTKYPLVEMDYRDIKALAKEEFKAVKRDIRRIVGKEQFEKLEKVFKKNGKLYIGTEDWVKIIFAFACAQGVKPNKRAKVMRPLYYARFLSFYKDYLDKEHKVAEQGIIKQAELAYEQREELIAKERA